MTPTEVLDKLDALAAKVMAEPDDGACAECGDPFDCGDLEPTALCNLCAQQIARELGGDVRALVAAVRAGIAMRSQFEDGQELDVTVFDTAIAKLCAP